MIFNKLKKGRLRLSTCIILLISISITSSFAQSDVKQLTLEDIYVNNVYASKGFGPVRWMKDNKGYSTLEPNASLKGNDIVRYEADGVSKTILVNASQLIPSGTKNPLVIADYVWSPDNTKILIFTNTRKVWRLNTRGDYWVLNLSTGKLKQLGARFEPTTLMFAKFSPDSKKVAYVSKLNIYAEDLATHTITTITTDGGDNIINGTFDWVYEEELGCRDGFRWSPDSKQIAYWQSNTKGVGTFYMINNIDSN